MSENLKPIQRLDLEKLKGRITKVISTEEALKDVEPMEWPKEVLSGKKGDYYKEEVKMSCKN